VAEARFYVYVHRQADTGEVFYVGKGQGKRAHSHADRNRHWHHVVEKHGRTVHMVAEGLTEEQAIQQEIALIAERRSAGTRLVNLTSGGQGLSGHIDTEETRAKKRASALGRRMSPEAIAKTASSRIGKRHSEETVQRIKDSLKGRRTRPSLSRETIDRIAAGNRGRKHSEETRAKMSAKAKGSSKRPQSPEHRAKIAQKRREYWDRWRAAKAASI
jgi:hypothetical protein